MQNINFTKYIPVTLLFLFVIRLYPAATYQINLVQSSQSALELQVTMQEPELQVEGKKNYAVYDKAFYSIAKNGAYVPYISTFFNLPQKKNSTVTITNVTWESKTVPNYRIVSDETLRQQATDALVTTSYLGMYREYPVHILKIFPVQYNTATQKLRWIKSIRVKIIGQAVNDKAVIRPRIRPGKLSGRLFVNGSGQLYAVSDRKDVSPLSKQEEKYPQENPALNYSQIYKIAVKQEGLYKITYDDLKNAGYPVDFVNPQALRLFNKGIEIPIYFHGDKNGRLDEGDYFEFWGEPNEKTFLKSYPEQYKDPFSDINIYWLVLGENKGRRLVEESGGLIKTAPGTYIRPYAFRETLHFEKDRVFIPFGDKTAGINMPGYLIDHWYPDRRIAAVESKTYDCYLPHPFAYGNQVYVKAAFRGLSLDDKMNAPGQGHQLTLWLNGRKVSEVKPADEWRGQALRFVSNMENGGLPQSNLKHGTNEIRVDMEQTGVTDVVLLNWFEISYLRKYRADNDYIKFRVQENLPRNLTTQFEIDGFKDKNIHVYKLGVSKIVNMRVDVHTDNTDQLTSYRVSFQDDVFDPKIEYVALTDEQKKKPLSITEYKSWKRDRPQISLLDKSNKANYLIITNDLLYVNASRIRTIQNNKGFQTEVVRVEDIYNTFNYGIKSPLAIKEFIKYVYEEWDQNYPLQYVLLVGDASNDYKGILKKGSDLVPTILYETHTFGAAASDFQYQLISGDDYIPDISIGRIPASNNEELSNYIDKMLAYEQDSPVDEWRNKALFISGFDAGSGDREYVTNKPIFRSQNRRIINMKLPKMMFARNLNTVRDESQGENDPHYGSTTDLIEYFDDGLSFINFLGHGGGGIWADVNLLNLNDVERLSNGPRYPFVASMTCYTGSFENAGRKALGEALILAEEKGAIGILASSSVAWRYNDFTIGWSLYDYLWQDNLTFGQAVDLMKMYYLANPVYFTEKGTFTTLSYYDLYKSMVSQYNFMGDPALRIKKPKSTLQINVSNAVPAVGDTVVITLPAGQINGSGRLEVTDSNNRILLETPFNLNAAGVSVSFPVPSQTEGQTLSVKAYLTDGIEDAVGVTRMAVQSSFIERIVISPDTPQVTQPLDFKVIVKSYREIETMRLLRFRELRYRNYSYYPDEIEMAKVNDSTFQSQNSFPGFTSGGEKAFDVYMRDVDGTEYTFRWQKFYVIDPRPDLEADASSLSYSGTDNLQIKFVLQNDSDQELSNIKVACYDSAGVAAGLPFAEPIVNFAPGEEKQISVNYSPSTWSEFRRFKIIADVDNSYTERSEQNNIIEKKLHTDHLLIRKQYGTSRDDTLNDTLLLEHRWYFYISKNSLSASTVLNFYEEPIGTGYNLEEQQSIQYTPFDNSTDTSGIYLDFLNYQNQPLNTTALLSVQIDTSVIAASDVENLAFHRYDRYLNRWIKLDSYYDNQKISTNVQSSGLYAVLLNSDDKKPLIEITANGRRMRDKMYVSKKPQLAFVLQDENGVNFKESFKAFIDGEEISNDYITFPEDLQNPNTISLLATPELESGEHELEVRVADVNGNETIKSVDFLVSSDFDFIVYGNYPNPFAEETRISYTVIGEELDNLDIKIYTTSGRLIRTAPLTSESPDENILDLNYHELIWDGTDDDGNPVGNGVYFGVITGSFKGKKIKHTIKMARLQ